MGGGSSKPDPAISRRLIIYSELTTQLPGFTDVMKAIAPAVVGWQYCFAGPKATDADQFVAQLSKLVKQYTQGRGFESIALITHGPKPPAPPPEGEDCLWELSGRIVLTDPSHLLRDSHAVNQVMRVLGSGKDLDYEPKMGHTVDLSEFLRLIVDFSATGFATT